MITPWMVYLIGILDNVSSLFKAAAMLLGLTFVFSLAFCPILNDLNIVKYSSLKRFLFKVVAAFVVCGSISAFAPSSKLAAAMYIIPAIANNENMKAIGGNSLEALRKLTEQWLFELGDTKTEKKGSEL